MRDEMLIAFEQELIAYGKARKTIISYTRDIRDFIEWLKNKGIKFDGRLSRIHVTQYKEYLLKMEYAIDTINKSIRQSVS